MKNSPLSFSNHFVLVQPRMLLGSGSQEGLSQGSWPSIRSHTLPFPEGSKHTKIKRTPSALSIICDIYLDGQAHCRGCGRSPSPARAESWARGRGAEAGIQTQSLVRMIKLHMLLGFFPLTTENLKGTVHLKVKLSVKFPASYGTLQ